MKSTNVLRFVPALCSLAIGCSDSAPNASSSQRIYDGSTAIPALHPGSTSTVGVVLSSVRIVGTLTVEKGGAERELVFSC
jgi:hypothetical protein